MSFISNQAYNACQRIDIIKRKLCTAESGEGSLSAENWATAIIKLACIFIIGLVIIESVYDNAGLNNSSAPFFSLASTVKDQITSGYTLASLLVLVVGAGAVIHFLGFM